MPTSLNWLINEYSILDGSETWLIDFLFKEIECKVIKLTDICSTNQLIKLLETRCDEDGALELRQMHTIAPPWVFTTSMIICVQN